MHIRPFENHLREAIALNRGRAPLYAALSDGASRPVSRALIAAESILLPVAWWFDRAAAPYHDAGIPLLEALFVPMSTAPAFGSVTLSSEKRPAASPVDTRGLRSRIARAHRTHRFVGAATAIATELAAMEQADGGAYLVRHLMESAHRLAALAPHLIMESKRQGLRSPEPLLHHLFLLHVWGLTSANALDNLARPIQARGIPILAQDLPPIPVIPSAPEPPTP